LLAGTYCTFFLFSLGETFFVHHIGLDFSRFHTQGGRQLTIECLATTQNIEVAPGSENKDVATNVRLEQSHSFTFSSPRLSEATAARARVRLPKMGLASFIKRVILCSCCLEDSGSDSPRLPNDETLTSFVVRPRPLPQSGPQSGIFTRKGVARRVLRKRLPAGTRTRRRARRGGSIPSKRERVGTGFGLFARFKRLESPSSKVRNYWVGKSSSKDNGASRRKSRAICSRCGAPVS